MRSNLGMSVSWSRVCNEIPAVRLTDGWLPVEVEPDFLGLAREDLHPLFGRRPPRSHVLKGDSERLECMDLNPVRVGELFLDQAFKNPPALVIHRQITAAVAHNESLARRRGSPSPGSSFPLEMATRSRFRE